ncbi:dihydroxyacetone kinase subunit DhaK [Spiractinospora alimapuensis]|uniref:dihydroxyacetone kinase family protein n=1 Tax=Spiractinospora alimapuensis TaxID=2820884 RepID=UPI001EEC3870|nr:dihydroxyacetone kinase family protein [Spiractinospora alimapuensis]QVQ53852.1 dihydroxyacetone kinase subunit DhaK [Spiractinospora alimapuensis]
MKKIINDPADFVDEVVEGILLAHSDELRPASADCRALVRADAGTAGRVGIVTGGGSGHLPFFLGYVGRGLASGVAVGNVFSSPSAEQIHAATLASDDGAGVLYLYGNYGGDVYNFDIAGDLALADGVRTTTVIGTDDILSAPEESMDTRRGVAGLIFAYKTAGAAAERGDDLDSVTEIARRTVARSRTMGVGLSPTFLPAAGKPTFTLADGEMEVGIGIHGEPGNHRGPLEPADSIADRFLTELLEELDLTEGSRVAVLVNGLGATPLEELYLLYRRTHQVLAERGVTVHRKYVGEYATSLEMAGASLSILNLDDELTELIDAPARSPFFTQIVTEPAPEAGAKRTVGAVATGAAADTPTEVRTVADPGPLRSAVLAVVDRLPHHAEELRESDAALGDGDLGITISSGAEAVRDAVSALPETAHPSEILRAAGAAFASANPSTYAALVGGGLITASRSVTDATRFTSRELATAARALLDHIMARGGAAVGDKTVVDVIAPVVDVLESQVDQPAGAVADAALTAARAAVDEGTSRTSKRGRASWVGERSVGRPDPGSVAFLRFVEDVAQDL